jgi:hypothetical protein
MARGLRKYIDAEHPYIVSTRVKPSILPQTTQYLCLKNKEMEKETQMLKIAEQWKTSGKSRIEFAREHNVTIHSLNYWCKKLRRRDSARQPEPKL